MNNENSRSLDILEGLCHAQVLTLIQASAKILTNLILNTKYISVELVKQTFEDW